MPCLLCCNELTFLFSFPFFFWQEVVIMHWACAKITASAAIQDAPLLETLLDKVCTSIKFKWSVKHLLSCYDMVCCKFWNKHVCLQLKLCKGISYAAIAAHADNCGRRKLAALLVDHEPRSSKQACSIAQAKKFFLSFVCINFIC